MMSKWLDKSDPEINKAVAKTRNLNWNVSAVDSDVIMIDCCEVFDPCNVVNDSWPIIIENNISIFSVALDSGIWQAEHYCHNGVKDKNPLRAAMIAYLEMKGVQP